MRCVPLSRMHICLLTVWVPLYVVSAGKPKTSSIPTISCYGRALTPDIGHRNRGGAIFIFGAGGAGIWFRLPPLWKFDPWRSALVCINQHWSASGIDPTCPVMYLLGPVEPSNQETHMAGADSGGHVSLLVKFWKFDLWRSTRSIEISIDLHQALIQHVLHLQLTVQPSNQLDSNGRGRLLVILNQFWQSDPQRSWALICINYWSNMSCHTSPRPVQPSNELRRILGKSFWSSSVMNEIIFDFFPLPPPQIIHGFDPYTLKNRIHWLKEKILPWPTTDMKTSFIFKVHPQQIIAWCY